MSRSFFLLSFLLGFSRPVEARPIEHVIVVSIDGLTPPSYTDPDGHGLKVPTLRKMVAEGVHANGVDSVYPSVTYPSHTSMVTGVNPGKHAIKTNHAWDPLDDNYSGWYWYAEDIATPTLWGIAKRAGKKVAMIHWPVTVGAGVDLLVPEYWRAQNQEDQKIQRALSTPGLFARVIKRFPDFWSRYNMKYFDQAATDIAVETLLTDRPHLMFLHIWQVDDAQHEHGLWSAQAKTAIENADAQLARLLEALGKAGIADRAALVVVSDHGFRNYEKLFRPGVTLKKAGLVKETGKDKPALQSWQSVMVVNGGSAYIYVAPNAGDAVKQKVEALFRRKARDGKRSGVGVVLSAAEIAARGGDPTAFLALEAAPGWALADGYRGNETETKKGATHGWDPASPEMKASFLAIGPALPRTALRGGRLVDLAPTIAGWLGLSLPAVDGQPLPIDVRR